MGEIYSQGRKNEGRPYVCLCGAYLRHSKEADVAVVEQVMGTEGERKSGHLGRLISPH